MPVIQSCNVQRASQPEALCNDKGRQYLSEKTAKAQKRSTEIIGIVNLFHDKFIPGMNDSLHRKVV